MSTRTQIRAARVVGWIDPKTFTDPRRDAGFLAFVRTKPCMITDGLCAGRIESHHEPAKSTGTWSDRNSGPLCGWHHRGPHGRHGDGLGSREAFERHYALDQAAIQIELNAEYEAQGGPLF